MCRSSIYDSRFRFGIDEVWENNRWIKNEEENELSASVDSDSSRSDVSQRALVSGRGSQTTQFAQSRARPETVAKVDG